MIRAVCALCMKAFDGEDEQQVIDLMAGHECRLAEFVGEPA